MNIEEFREYCLSFEYVTESKPLDEHTLVMKVFGKMFALVDIENFTSFNIKFNPEIAQELRLQYARVKAGSHMNKKDWNTIEVQ
jgi:predicted DNA-binding protein (MmcQ/YjbR family)